MTENENEYAKGKNVMEKALLVIRSLICIAVAAHRSHFIAISLVILLCIRTHATPLPSKIAQTGNLSCKNAKTTTLSAPEIQADQANTSANLRDSPFQGLGTVEFLSRFETLLFTQTADVRFDILEWNSEGFGKICPVAWTVGEDHGAVSQTLDGVGVHSQMSFSAECAGWYVPQSEFFKARQALLGSHATFALGDRITIAVKP